VGRDIHETPSVDSEKLGFRRLGIPPPRPATTEDRTISYQDAATTCRYTLSEDGMTLVLGSQIDET